MKHSLSDNEFKYNSQQYSSKRRRRSKNWNQLSDFEENVNDSDQHFSSSEKQHEKSSSVVKSSSDAYKFNTSLQFNKFIESSSSDLESDSEVEDEQAVMNVKKRSVCIFFINVIIADLLSSFCKIRNSQLCEHIHDNMWSQTAWFVKISKLDEITDNSKILISEMLKVMYHWQWLYIFVVMRFNSKHLRWYDALVSNEMSLEKVKSTDLLFNLSCWFCLRVDVWNYRCHHFLSSTV